MSGTNDFLPFATGGGANVQSQAAYAADAQTSTGQIAGIASSARNNKALRQASSIAAALAQFMANTTGLNVVDNGVQADLLAVFTAAFPGKIPPTQTTLNATGTAAGYLFTVSTANATAGATYTNNGNTYTVLSTLASGTLLFCSQASAPLASGTLTKASGTGDSTITFSANQPLALYTVPANVSYLTIEAVGPGAGGGGSNGAGDGSPGTLTVFGSNLLVLNSGLGGNSSAGNGGAGGLGTYTGSLGFAMQGNGGGSGSITGPSQSGYPQSGAGAPGPWGGAGQGVSNGNPGVSAANNSGAGGSGAVHSIGNNAVGGGGGGMGAYGKIQINTLAASYYYAVGTGGSAGPSAGTGGSGKIIITEHYGS